MDIDRDMAPSDQRWLQEWLTQQRGDGGELAAVPMEGVEDAPMVPPAYTPADDIQAEAAGDSAAWYLMSMQRQSSVEQYKVYLLDTNVLLSNLHSIKQLANKLRRIMSSDVVCLPYVVLDELDRLKDRKMGDGKYIALYAQSAIRFVNAELSDATSVVRLQSVKEAKQAEKDVELPEVSGARYNDDQILRAALALSRNPQATTVMVTNDQALQAKCKANGIAVATGRDVEGRFPAVVQQVMSMRKMDTWNEEQKEMRASDAGARSASQVSQEAVAAVQPDFMTLAATYIVFYVSNQPKQSIRHFVTHNLGLSERELAASGKGPLSLLLENMTDLRIAGQLLGKLGGAVRVKAVQLSEAAQQTNAPKIHTRMLRIMWDLSEEMLSQFEANGDPQHEDTQAQFKRFNRQVGKLLSSL